MDLLGFLKKKLYRKECWAEVPFRGFVFLPEGNYPADIYTVAVKEKKKLFGKEEYYLEYEIFLDEPIPVPSPKDGSVPMNLFQQKVRGATGYKQALSWLGNHVEWRRMMEGKEGWDKNITYKNVEFDKPLFGADAE
ncbi:hypothetical protein Spock_176 [Bacillus phage Spock]|uniref:Uncharacterized protein n=1 Tax=Bacillus phage Spock TaxID=1406791 RepID=U5PXT9_9CAUD|nr:hypothetical protein Spock_176 [Bacillus phage Spock]AGY48576.1 hypothetical protein Spock_176 [Bacillus phage Spock]